MFRDQVYNTLGRGSGQLNANSQAYRRLTRRIHHNIGLLNTSRSSNHSSSFRMPRTELSNERYNTSRDHSQHSSQAYDNNYNRAEGASRDPTNRRNLSRRRLNNQQSPQYPLNQNRGKNLVENLYMLTNNQRQYQIRRQQPARGINYQPQSPRSRNYNPVNYEQKREKRPSRDRNQGRYALPSRQSKLGMRQRSKDHQDNKVIEQQRQSSRERDRKYQYAGHYQRRHQQPQQAEERNRQNIYQLKSPNKRADKRRSEKQIGKPSTNSTKNMNLYYFQQTQVSSTSGGTVGVKTLPETSKVQTISEASLPVHSIASNKDVIQKESKSPRVHHKSSLRLQRSKDRPPIQAKNKRKDKQQEEREEKQVNKLLVPRKANNPDTQPRSKKQMLKGRQKNKNRQDDALLLGSVFLPVQSKREQGREWAQDILERIILHLECLNVIADYTKQFRKMYENTEQWQTLIFLSYKKFYIERTKVEAILKAPPLKQEIQESRLTQGCENPFCFPYSKISEQELCRFRGSRECLALRQQLQAQNNRIRNALRGLYNLYIEKSGDHVNMLDCDNFSQQIYKLMLEEVEGISQNLQESSLVEVTKIRLGKIIRTGLIIAFINGKYIKNFAQILLHEDIIKIGKRETLREDCAADLFVAEFKRVLS